VTSADASVPDASAADAAVAEPPFPLQPAVPRRAGSIRLVPGALRAGARYALIAAGCTGPGARDQPDACGEPDALSDGAAALLLAEISSEVVAGADRIGLQFINASRAVSRADLTLQSETGPASAPFGNDVPFGAVRPFQAAAVPEPIGVELHVRRERLPSYTQAWADAESATPLGSAELGRNHLLAYVGPLPAGSFVGLAPPRFVLILGR
jgi:hypothetical protein